MDVLRISFDQITTLLSFNDTMNMFISCKTILSFNTNEYWKNKARYKYKFDIAKIEFYTESCKKYKMIEQLMTQHHSNILAYYNIPMNSYMWNKKAEFVYGLMPGEDIMLLLCDKIDSDSNYYAAYCELCNINNTLSYCSSLVEHFLVHSYHGFIKKYVLPYGLIKWNSKDRQLLDLNITIEDISTLRKMNKKIREWVSTNQYNKIIRFVFHFNRDPYLSTNFVLTAFRYASSCNDKNTLITVDKLYQWFLTRWAPKSILRSIIPHIPPNLLFYLIHSQSLKKSDFDEISLPPSLKRIVNKLFNIQTKY